MVRYLYRHQGLKSFRKVRSYRLACNQFSYLPSSRARSPRMFGISLEVSLPVLRIQRLIIQIGSYMQIHQDLQNINESDRRTNVQSLQYEVSLLRERNRILALQNQNLVSRIQELEKAVSKQNQYQVKYQSEQRAHNHSQLKQKSALVNLIKCLQKNIIKADSVQVEMLYQMIKNACSTAKIISEISQFLQSQQSQQTAKISNMSRLQKLVGKRKEKLSIRESNNKQIVHIVKEPTMSENYLSEGDLQFILNSSEKLIRRVKKCQIPTQSLTNIFRQISKYIRLRMNIRKRQKQLKVKQREQQLGVGCRIIFEQYSAQLISLNSEELSKKKHIEQKIFQL